MPIKTSVVTNRISQDEFAPLAYEVMEHVFDIYRSFGSLFHERVYKRELANRLEGVQLEVPVDVTHGSFTKRYFIDALAKGSGLFEFKTAESIHDRHTAQVIHYLLLLDLAHGKIINIGPERVESRFINCSVRLCDLRAPVVEDPGWDLSVPGAQAWKWLCTRKPWSTSSAVNLQSALKRLCSVHMALSATRD